MASGKISVLYVLHVLQEYSDENHIMSMGEIQDKINMIYGTRLDRRVIYGCMDTLIEAGYDISLYSDNNEGYYLRDRLFDNCEIMLLSDAVMAFPFISAVQSGDLRDRLQKLLPVGQRHRFGNLRICTDGKKTPNKQVFWTVELLDRAITEKRKVSFTYLEYGYDKQLHPRREKPYKVSPHTMVYTNEHYYLVCTADKYTDLSFYRIDYIGNPEITDEIIETHDIDFKIVEKAVYAFSGEPEKIRIKCSRWILNDVLDKFGTDTVIIPESEDAFTAIFTASGLGVKYWLMQYLPYVKVISPAWLKCEIEKTVKDYN